MFHVPNEMRIRHGVMGSTDDFGNRGAFSFRHEGKNIFIIASDGEGWEHVSVSIQNGGTPSWNTMCRVKDIFWDEEDTVIQFHPPKSQYVNKHKYCLHLWRKIDFEQPIPPKILVG